MLVEHLAGYLVDFGEEVTWSGGTFSAIFDLPTDDRGNVLSQAPMLTVPAADIGALAAGDAVTVRGVAYTVRTVQPDGTGLVLLTVTTP